MSQLVKFNGVVLECPECQIPMPFTPNQAKELFSVVNNTIYVVVRTSPQLYCDYCRSSSNIGTQLKIYQSPVHRDSDTRQVYNYGSGATATGGEWQPGQVV